MDSDELVTLLRNTCQAEGSVYRFAKNRGLSEGYVRNVLYGNHKPGPKIAIALGMKKVVSYEPIK